MMMRINDNVYGEEEIREQVLIDLINSKAIQRLKGISQYGLPEEYYHLPCFSRFDHSIGVMILLRRLNASLEEQIAGLLHDVSHTAFSHTIDWVFDNSMKEDFQDKNLLGFIEGPEIKEILEKHGFIPKKIADIEKFFLLERPAPNLCADRVDYTLREIVLLHNKKDANFILKSLINFNMNIVFTSLEASKLFTKYYVGFEKNHWNGDESKMQWHILANILKKALSNKIISLNDFEKDDSYIINILLRSNDDEILEKLKILKNGFKIEYVEEGIIIRKKFRWVDPFILINNSLVKLSDIFEDYKKIIEEEKLFSENPKKVKIIENESSKIL